MKTERLRRLHEGTLEAPRCLEALLEPVRVMVSYPDTEHHPFSTRRTNMSEKLVQGDRFPTIRLDLIDGSTIDLPRQAPSRYLALIFYRGEW